MTKSASKIQQIREMLNRRVFERQTEIDMALVAVLAGEHVLMLGPPGTAKSFLARSITSAIKAKYFERLMTKFTTPEEVFGPMSLKGLENDEYRRVVRGKMPEAEIVFVDEVFKANSAILNSYLTLMNERVYHNDDQPMKCPLITMFGASNEMPEGKELDAMYDRFLIRLWVSPIVRESSLRAMLTATDDDVAPVMDTNDLRQIQQKVRAIKITDDTVQALIDVRSALLAEGMVCSERRLKKVANLLKAVAYLNDNEATKTSVEDLAALVDCFWREHTERPKVARVVGAIADPISVRIQEVLDAARETYQKVTATKQQGGQQAFKAAAIQAVTTFQQQRTAVMDMLAGGGKRAKALARDVTDELDSMEVEFSRVIASGLNLRGMQINITKNA